MAMLVIREILAFSKEYPIVRGMAAYAILWPSSNICQQMIQRKEKIDFYEASRFSLFGSLYVAPTLFTWVRVASKIFPGQSLKIAVKKVLLEQVLYSPFAISSFYIGMTLLETHNLEEAIKEWKNKFIPTYKTGLLVWPLVQTVNFAFIKERNRVPFSGVVSFFWAVFLSYMKRKDMDNKNDSKN